nr:MAG TPA: hypothetical protein [Bacteriophage sp.]
MCTPPIDILALIYYNETIAKNKRVRRTDRGRAGYSL